MVEDCLFGMSQRLVSVVGPIDVEKRLLEVNLTRSRYCCSGFAFNVGPNRDDISKVSSSRVSAEITLDTLWSNKLGEDESEEEGMDSRRYVDTCIFLLSFCVPDMMNL